MSTGQQRILIVRIGAMGDVLHAMPAVAALREVHPQCRIGWVVEPRWFPLLQAVNARTGMPVVNQTFLAATREWKRRPVSSRTLSEVAQLRREIRNGGFDLCVDMQGSIRSAVIGRMASARDLVGPADPREGPARWLYGRTASTTARHVIEQGCELLGTAVGAKLQPAPLDFPRDAAVEKACDALLERLLPGGERFVLIAPTAGWGAKQWPAERFGAVAAKLGAQGYGTLVNAAGEEDPIARSVVAASGAYAAAAAGDLPFLIALTRRAEVVIAGDTGPLHLAAALRRPVVALFGPTDPTRNGPYGTRAKVIRHGEERRDHRRLAEPEEGLLAITVEEVVQAVLELLTADPSTRSTRSG